MPIAKYYFYSVNADGYSFPETLDALYSYPCNERACDIDGRTCLLLDKQVSIAGCRASLLTRIRMTGLPHKIKTDGSLLLLDLEEDEGLGEHVSIAYHPELNILAVQNNRLSLSANGICVFFQTMMPGLNLSLTPILSRDALERFAKCHTLRKVRIKVAGTGDLSFLEDTRLSTDDKIAIQQMMENPHVDLTISMGYKTGSLGDKVRNLVDFFRNLSNTESGKDIVQVLQITGREEERTQSVLIDLLSERLTYEQQVDLENRTVDTDHLLRIACAAIAKNAQELRSLHAKEAC